MMSMRVLLVEDEGCRTLTPIALLRPAFELLCGHHCLRARVCQAFPDASWGVSVRPWLQDVYREEHPDCHVNDDHWMHQDSVLVINGRWIPDGPLSRDMFDSARTGRTDDGQIAWIHLDRRQIAELQSDWDCLEDFCAPGPERPVGGILIRHPWDAVERNSRQIELDFSGAGVSQQPSGEHVCVLGDPCDVYVSERAVIDPFVVIDARSGPVSIGHDVHIQPFTRIEGPAHVASESRLFRAHIRAGTTIGPVCRVGGEIEESILHSYVTKYHDGFLGHSYVSPWVNFGAMTTTSDLKNNYADVKVPLQGRPVPTGLSKVGTFFGDHTKTAVDSMFNTGSSIGVMCMVLPDGGLLPRHIPSFSSVLYGTLSMSWTLESGLDAARVAMSRRGRALTPALEQQLRTLYELTREERERALARVARRKAM